MKKVFNIIGLTLIAATLTLVGCRKKETVEVDNETQSAVDDAVAYQEYASIMPTVNNHAVNTKGTGANNNRSSSAPCNVLNFLNEVATATVNGKVFPAADTNLLNGKYIKIPVYQLDFSNAATTCSLSFSDGKVRTGIWTVYFTGPLTKAGSQVVIKLQNHKTLNKINYACDSIIVTTVTNNTVAPKYIEYNVKLVNGVCTTSDWTIKYTFDRTFKHYPNGVSGNSDPVTMMWGTANGITRQGKPFIVSTEASNPLVKHKSCEFIDKGATSLTPEGFKTRTVDFGNGTCDDKATFTVNGNTVEFKLK
jgi:hypothetical protein